MTAEGFRAGGEQARTRRPRGDTQIAALGLKRGMALRIAVRRVAGFVEVDAATVAALRDLARQIGGVATNINQIAKAANRTHDPDCRAFMVERAALGRGLARVEGLMQPVLELGAPAGDQRLSDALTGGPCRRRLHRRSIAAIKSASGG